MRKISQPLSLTAILLAAPLFAVSQHKEHHGAGSGEHSREHQAGGTGMRGMMDPEDMQPHMREMQNMMEQIHNTEDPARRRELMRQHMRKMHDGMEMMGGGMMSGGDGAQEDMSTEERLDMMQKQLGMMHAMMMQMMLHFEEDIHQDQRG